MNPETWQLDSAPLTWTLEDLNLEPLETVDYGQLETLDSLRSDIGSRAEMKAETLPK